MEAAKSGEAKLTAGGSRPHRAKSEVAAFPRPAFSMSVSEYTAYSCEDGGAGGGARPGAPGRGWRQTMAPHPRTRVFELCVDAGLGLVGLWRFLPKRI